MREVQLSKATPLPTEWREAIEQGETLLIRGEDGSQIAQLVPERDAASQLKIEDAIENLRIFRKTMPKITLEEMLAARHEGHNR